MHLFIYGPNDSRLQGDGNILPTTASDRITNELVRPKQPDSFSESWNVNFL